MSIVTNNTNTIELVFVPMPGMGHLLAAVEFSKLLLSRDERICITIYIINRHITKLNSYVKSQSLDNPYPTRFTLCVLPSLDLLDPLTPTFFLTLFDLHKPLFKKAVEDRIKSGSPKPAGFILDMFATAMIDIAAELDIPCYIFHTSGANFLNLMFHAQSLADHHGVDIATEFSDPGTEILVPGFKNPVTSKVVPALLQNHESVPVYINHVRRYREKIVKGILVNTFMELEPCALPASISMGGSTQNEVKIPPIYPVGPILELNDKIREAGNTQDRAEILQWLNHQPEFSVVFLCFGSMGWLSADQVQEIAKALDKSGHRFMWALRKPPSHGMVRGPPSNNNEIFIEALPEGFLDRTAHRGKIIGWAPQVSILAHSAIRGFVSHCGWNSILESFWHGVPIATWPIHAEQQLNAFELVTELGLAIEITMDYKQSWKTREVDTIVTAEEIEMGINKLMGMDGEMRERVRDMRDQSRKTLQCGGSSYNWLGRFIQDVLDNNVASST